MFTNSVVHVWPRIISSYKDVSIPADIYSFHCLIVDVFHWDFFFNFNMNTIKVPNKTTSATSLAANVVKAIENFFSSLSVATEDALSSSCVALNGKFTFHIKLLLKKSISIGKIIFGFTQNENQWYRTSLSHTHTQQSVGFGACFWHEVIDMQREFRERHGNNKSDWELVFTAETKKNKTLTSMHK